MEPKTSMKESFFIVRRGTWRKGTIGRVEAETARGELVGVLYSGGSNPGSPKKGAVLRKEDMHPLTQHQAQLLLFVSNASKRMDLLCNPQLFLAICELSQDDLVVVKYKKEYVPGLVRNLMQIGKKENKEDLCMLAFQVEFLEDNHDLSRKPAPLPLFSAADIIQVVPSNTVSTNIRWSDGKSLNRKALNHISSMPSIGSLAQQVTGFHQKQTEPSALPNQRFSLPHAPLEVGSMVEVASNTGVIVYGVIRWLGTLEGKTEEWTGIELDYEVTNCSDGTYKGQRYFTCKGSRALFVPIARCNPDSRFFCNPTETEILKPKQTPPVPANEDSCKIVPPVPESEVLSLLVGRMKGIQGHNNSCYLDATLFSLFSLSMVDDSLCQKPAETDKSLRCSLRVIVNCLRSYGFVPAESVMKFRKQLGCDTFRKDEKDPEEFITVLFQKVLCMEPLLTLRSEGELSQGYTYQIILEKEQMGPMPTVQQLLDTSCLSADLKFESMPSCLIIQMPRFGNKYKMFPYILPSTELDVTDLLYNSLRECFICGRMAEFECLQCLPDPKLQPGRIKQFCTTCSTQVHSHAARRGHSPRSLTVPADVAADVPAPRRTMQLFAVLCIKTSHYVSFVKYGSAPQSWLFFNSMADRCGNDQNGYNIPEIRTCPEVGDFLCQSEAELVRANPLQAPELVRRLLCDSYMFLYQKSDTARSDPNNGGP